MVVQAGFVGKSVRKRCATVFLAALLSCFALALAACGETAGNLSSSSSSAASASGESSGGASAADGEQELAIGDFSWSGGSGRLKGMDCTRLVVRDGVVYATIAMQSSSYSTVRVGDAEYKNLTPDTEVSTFEIPITLGANIQISGLTTAMSSPHWVDYTLYCTSADSADAASQAVDSSAFDETPPAILGLSAQGQEPLEAAELFRVFNYDGGVRLVEVRVPQSDASSAEGGLYGGTVLRYLVAPVDVELAAGLEKSYIIVRPPVQGAYVLDDSALACIAQLGKADCVGLVAEALSGSLEEHGIQGVSASGALENVDFREVVLHKSDLIVVNGSVAQLMRDDKPLISSYGESAQTLGIPLVVDCSADERSANAQREWIKFYGALLGCYDSACALYESDGD